MEAVYPITALYFGPLAVWFYQRYGRRKSVRMQEQHKQHKHAHNPHGGRQRVSIRWNQISEADSHCGAGCTLGDIIGEWLVLAFGITIAAKALYADYIFDFFFAWSLGVFFQYFTIVPMRNLGKREGVWQAIKADTFSIVAFQVGLFAGMFVYQQLLFEHPLPKITGSYWFLMQLAMVLGFFTAYPVNYLLLKTGVKERM